MKEDFEFSKKTGTIKEYFGKETNVIIPSEIDGVPVTTIGEGAFAFCIYLESVTIPESVTKIEDFAFEECTSLKNINIESDRITIWPNAFKDCEPFDLNMRRDCYVNR